MKWEWAWDCSGGCGGVVEVLCSSILRANLGLGFEGGGDARIELKVYGIPEKLLLT